MLSLAPICAMAITGCAARDNDRLTLGKPGDGVALGIVQEDAAMSPAAGPSVTGTDRSAWEETTVLVPLDGTDACAFGSSCASRAANARHAGGYPKPEEAVDLRRADEPLFGPRAWGRAPGSAQ